MTDVDVLTRSAPGPVEIDRLWPATSREGLLEHLRSGSTPAGPRRRSYRGLAVGALVAAVALAVPVAVRLDAPNAALSARLTEGVGARPDLTITRGRFLHRVETSTDATGKPLRREEWVAADGTTWGLLDALSGTSTSIKFPPEPVWGGLPRTPDLVAKLPTSGPELAAYVKEHGSGVITDETEPFDEATYDSDVLFIYVEDLLRMGYAPPAVERAALEAAVSLPDVSTTTSSLDGRGVVAVTRVRSHPGGVRTAESLYFDPESWGFVGLSAVTPESTVTVNFTAELVDGVPQRVLDHARPNTVPPS